MEIIYVIILGVAVAAFVTYPFWGKGETTLTEDPAIAGLEAARESKYREIRDAETDLASGKLSKVDFDRVNADLRQDAVEILDQLEDARKDAALAEGKSGSELPAEPVQEPGNEPGNESGPEPGNPAGGDRPSPKSGDS